MSNKRKSSVVCALAISLVTIMLIASLEVVGAVDPSLSNSGGGNWQFYREIEVRENSGSTLTDYQELLQLSGSYFPTTTSDGADIRFTDINGNELSYWIEKWNYPGKSASIWVKLPRIPGNGKSDIKMYYGNPSASSTSDGIKTFEHFDDFSGIHKITDYQVIDNSGSIEGPSIWTLDTINKKIIQGSNIYGGSFGSALLTGKSLASFEVKVKTKEVDNDIIGLLFSFQDVSNFNHYSYSNDYAGMQINTFNVFV